MATISKNWGSLTYIEGSAGAYTTLSGTTEEFSSDVDLETSGYVGAFVMVEVDFDPTPTDYVEIRVYASHDGTTYDDFPMMGFTIDKDTADPGNISFIVRDVPHFRVSFKQTGATNSHDVKCAYQAWNYSSA